MSDHAIKLPENHMKVARDLLSGFTTKLLELTGKDIERANESARRVGEFLAEKLHFAPKTFNYNPQELTDQEIFALHNFQFLNSLFKNKRFRPEKAGAIQKLLLKNITRSNLPRYAANFVGETPFVNTDQGCKTYPYLEYLCFQPDFSVNGLNTQCLDTKAEDEGSHESDPFYESIKKIFELFLSNKNNSDSWNIVTALNNWLDFQYHDFDTQS